MGSVQMKNFNNITKFILKLLLFLIFLTITIFYTPNKNQIYFSIYALAGIPMPSDIAQDFIGFRRMVDGRDIYPVMSLAVQEIGVTTDWEPIKSTHPPTAYLLTAPIAFLPWNQAATIWAWISIILIFISLLALKLSFSTSIFATIALLIWPPSAYSLGQFTALWLVAISLAWRFRDRIYLPGVLIAIASLTKFFPALLILPFIYKRKWKSVLAFFGVWVFAIVIVLIICPTAINQYLMANKENMTIVFNHQINGSLFYILPSRLGFYGWILLGSFFSLVIYLSRKLDSWILLQYLTVALLPFLWTYSLLPLLPIIIHSLKRDIISKSIGFLVLLIPLIFPTKGSAGAPFNALEVILIGLCIANLGLRNLSEIQNISTPKRILFK